MTQLLLVNGPNLGRLGSRSPEIYGTTSLQELQSVLIEQAAALGATLECFQSDVEGEIIRHIDANRGASGLILNPGALMMGGWSLRDCLEDFEGVKIEVHISHVFAREQFRRTSVIADVMDGFICGLGVGGYRSALEAIVRSLDATA